MIYSKSFLSSFSQPNHSIYETNSNTSPNHNNFNKECVCTHCPKLEDLILKLSKKYQRMKTENQAADLTSSHHKSKNKEAKKKKNKLQDSEPHERENYIKQDIKLNENKSNQVSNLNPAALKIMLAKLNIEIESLVTNSENYSSKDKEQESLSNKRTFKLEDFKKKISDHESGFGKIQRRKSSIALRKEEFLIYE